ncbi:MAG TPA: Trm112 family protein [Propionibacteriaceae bacterium]|nr:Trm112 family protein [Propionibacteriaceae bacterium]
MSVAVDLAPELLEILACPNCHGALAVDHDRDELVCLAAGCGLAYPVRQQIPVLLIDEARRPNSRTDHPDTSPGR